jgi:hypothetical protein
MKMYTVDHFSTDACNTCCCEVVGVKPGTSVKVTINYAPWAVPIGRLHCLPQFALEQKKTCPEQTIGNLPPGPIEALSRYSMAVLTTVGPPLEGDLKDNIIDPESDAPLTFKALPFHGPQYGKLVVNEDGTFEYTVIPNFKGEDRFFASVSDGTHTTVFEVGIAVGTDMAAMKPTPHVYVDQATINTNERQYLASFAVRASPAADMCEVWRLTVMQYAIDCECSCFNRADCFDIRMVNC